MKMFQDTNRSRSSAYGDYTTSTTHSQCRLHQSEQNYQAMLTMEPLDTAKHRRRPYRLIHSLRLIDERRHRRGTTLTCAAPVGGHGTASPTSGAPVRSCAPRGWTDTYTGGTSRADEGVENRDGLRDTEPKEPKPAPGQNVYCVEQLRLYIESCQWRSKAGMPCLLKVRK